MIKNDFNMPDKLFGLESDLLKLLLIPVILVILFFVSLQLIIVPRITSINELNSKTRELKGQIKSTEEKISYLASIDKNELEKDVDYLNNAVLGEKKSYLLIGVIRSIADKYGFQIKSFSTSPGKLKTEENIKISKVDAMTKISVDVVLVGTKQNYMELIMGLEKSLPIIFIDKFEVKTVADMVELDLIVSSYGMNDKVSVDVNSLSLADLKLKDEEYQLLKQISQFQKIEGVSSINQESTVKEYVKYDRLNPFSL